MEARRNRNNKLYPYEAGNGGTRALKGRSSDDKDPHRHGIALSVAGKVLTRFLGNNPPSFWIPIHKLPEQSDETAPLLSDKVQSALDMMDAIKVHHLDSADDIDALLARTNYVVIDFYDDTDDSPIEAYTSGQHTLLFEFANSFSEPGILTFATVNRVFPSAVAQRHCSDLTVETYVFFKDGKRVAVNGHRKILASDTAAEGRGREIWCSDVKESSCDARQKAFKDIAGVKIDRLRLLCCKESRPQYRSD